PKQGIAGVARRGSQLRPCAEFRGARRPGKDAGSPSSWRAGHTGNAPLRRIGTTHGISTEPTSPRSCPPQTFLRTDDESGAEPSSSASRSTKLAGNVFGDAACDFDLADDDEVGAVFSQVFNLGVGVSTSDDL